MIDILRVREILNPLPVTAVRDDGGVADGVIDLRGRVVPFVELRSRLGLPPAPPSLARKQIIAQVERTLHAFAVDAMGRVIEVERAAIQREGFTTDQAAAALVPGAVRHEGRLYLLLDLRAVLRRRPAWRERGGAS